MSNNITTLQTAAGECTIEVWGIRDRHVTVTVGGVTVGILSVDIVPSVHVTVGDRVHTVADMGVDVFVTDGDVATMRASGSTAVVTVPVPAKV